MSWFREYFFESEHSGHSALDQVRDESDLGTVSQDGLKTRVLVFALRCFVDRKTKEP